MREIERAIEATKKIEKKEIKREKGHTTIPFERSTLVLPLISCTPQILSFMHIAMWGPSHYRTWLVYSNDEPPQTGSRSSLASKLDAPPLVPLESFQLTCASVVWQSLLLTSYLSYGLLSPMIVLIDVSLSHLFVFLLHLLSVSPFRCQLSCSRSSIA